MLVSEIAKDCPLLYTETILKGDRGKEKVYHLEFGYRNVKFPGREGTLGLLVMRASICYAFSGARIVRLLPKDISHTILFPSSA